MQIQDTSITLQSIKLLLSSMVHQSMAGKIETIDANKNPNLLYLY